MVLTTQSTAQVYSPFGSYVVEQHDEGADLRLGCDECKPAAPPAGAQAAPKPNDTLHAA